MGIKHLKDTLAKLGISVHRSKRFADVIAVDLLYLLFKLNGTKRGLAPGEADVPVVIQSGRMFMEEISTLVNNACAEIAKPTSIVVVTMDLFGRFPMKDETREERAKASRREDERVAEAGLVPVVRYSAQERDLLVECAREPTYLATAAHPGIDVSRLKKGKDWALVRRLLEQLVPIFTLQRDSLQCVYVVNNQILLPANSQLPDGFLQALQEIQSTGAYEMPEADTQVVDTVIGLAKLYPPADTFGIVSSDQDLVPLVFNALWDQRESMDLNTKRIFLHCRLLDKQMWEKLVHKCSEDCKSAPTREDAQVGVDMNDLLETLVASGKFGENVQKTFTAFCVLCHTDYFKLPGKGPVKLAAGLPLVASAMAVKEDILSYAPISVAFKMMVEFFPKPEDHRKFAFNYHYWRTRRLDAKDWTFIGDRPVQLDIKHSTTEKEKEKLAEEERDKTKEEETKEKKEKGEQEEEEADEEPTQTPPPTTKPTKTVFGQTGFTIDFPRTPAASPVSPPQPVAPTLRELFGSFLSSTTSLRQRSTHPNYLDQPQRARTLGLHEGISSSPAVLAARNAKRPVEELQKTKSEQTAKKTKSSE